VREDADDQKSDSRFDDYVRPESCAMAFVIHVLCQRKVVLLAKALHSDELCTFRCAFVGGTRGRKVQDRGLSWYDETNHACKPLIRASNPSFAMKFAKFGLQ
jgi:hypothetical protein